MVFPSEINAVISAAEEAGRAGLALLTQTAREATQEGLAELGTWRERMKALSARYAAGGFSAREFAQAAESEKEALAFNLAAIGNERKRAFLSGLLGSSLDFLGRILGVAAGALKP